MSSSNNTVMGALALVASLLFVVLIALQVLELMYYRNPMPLP